MVRYDMTTQIIYLEDYDWLIKVYYAVDSYLTDEILGELNEVGCPTEPFHRAKQMLEDFEENTGFTYSDQEKHVSFVIIGLATSPEQFINTLVHEVGHATLHICEYYNIDPYSEELPYLQGDVMAALFPTAKNFLSH